MATRYDDPTVLALASDVERKLDLPSGLLASVITRGERSNSDQVSEAGARGIGQIIPATRKSAIDKYGIDPYLSDQNSLEVAGRLLKDSLDRNKGDAAAAVGEYHGGTDRANWGPRTTSYINRVTAALPSSTSNAGPVAIAVTARPTMSTFDKMSAASAGPTQPQIASILSAYNSGQMAPDDAKQFAADVKAGHIMLPRGAALNSPEDAQANADWPDSRAPAQPGAAPASSGAIPQAVLDAYSNGQMAVPDRIQLEHDVKQGLVQVPQGFQLHDTEAPGFFAKMKEQVTGADRQTDASNALPDWATMPELNQLSMASAKSGIGTMFSNPAETVQVIKANFPGVQVQQDQKGNFLLTSSVDGKQYAIKPGFQVSDIPRAAGTVAAFGPAAGATSIVGAGLAAGATQAAIEGTQAATGGSFDPGEVLAAGAGGALVPAAGRLVTSGRNLAEPMLNRLRGEPNPAAAAREVPPAAPGGGGGGAPGAGEPPIVVSPDGTATMPGSAPPGAPFPPTTPMNAQELGATARTAAGGGMGSKSATEELASQAAPDAKTVAAAERLGIRDNLQPDHVTTSQSFRELSQVVKSVPGSQMRAAELDGLEAVGRRAEKMIDDLGGTTDLSQVDASVRGQMGATIKQLENKADELYTQVREALPANTEAPANTVLDFVRGRAKELGGAENLTPMEKKILGRLSPKAVVGSEIVPGNPLMPGAQTATKRATMTMKQPTYTLLDDVRRDVGAAARQMGPFKDADTGLAKKLYSLISDDQAAAVGKAGVGELYDAARAAVSVRKGIEDDMASLFGKQIDKSITGQLAGAVRALPTGDSAKLVKMLAAVPENMRQQVMASGLANAFRTAGTRGPINFSTYAKWYGGLLRNKQAHAAVMANLPAPARKQLSDLYRVASGIAASSRERITTGRIMAAREGLMPADTLLAKLWDVAKRSGVGAAAGAVLSPIGGAGVGAAVGSALSRGAKPAVDRALDELMASPAFMHLAAQAGTKGEQQAVRAFAYSKQFAKFVRAAGAPREMSNKERFVLQALQGDNQTRH